jgi:ribonuclease R
MQTFGETCSMTERRADAASYDVVDWLKCEYIQDRVGEEFNGTVSSVTAFGLFVELNDIYVEGLVHITALKNDYYQFDPVRHLLRGERSGVTYHLGDVVRVKVVRVDLDDRKIDLGMVDGPLHTAARAPAAQDAPPRKKPAARDGARRKRKLRP